MGTTWRFLLLGYVVLAAIFLDGSVRYGVSATATVIGLGIATCVLTGVIFARRLVPPRLRLWFISAMAAVFTVASIARLIVQLLTQ